MKKLKDILITLWQRLDLVLVIIVGLLGLVVMILDATDQISASPWLKSSNITLLLLGTLAIYLVRERRQYFEEGQKKLEQSQNQVVNTQDELKALVTAMQQDSIDHTQEIIKAIETPKKERIVLVAETRVSIPNDVLELKYSAKKVDIIGVTLNSALKELVRDDKQRLIENLLFNNLQLRLFLSHPNSKYLAQRAAEDHWDQTNLKRQQVEAVRLCLEFYRQLDERYKKVKNEGRLDTRLTGSLQIKLLEYCPYVTIYRINDDQIYWGPYLSGVAGMNLPLFLTTSQSDSVLYKHLHNHIHGLMDCDKRYPEIVRMINVGEPQLDETSLKGLTIM